MSRRRASRPRSRPDAIVPLALSGGLALLLTMAACDQPGTPEPQPDSESETDVRSATSSKQLQRATGRFEPTVTPRETDDTPEGATLGHSSIGKRFHGDLEGSAQGAMLTALTPAEGSAGYVAIERVEGSLHGRRGAFLLQHSGLMDRGEQQLSIRVIPDSATDELEGLEGTMSISVVDGRYDYELDYTLPATDAEGNGQG